VFRGKQGLRVRGAGTWHRRRVTAAGASLIATGTLGLALTGTFAQAAAKKLTTVQLATAPSALQSLPLSLAQSLGYFKKNGLKVPVTIVSSGSAIVAALQSNSVQFASATATPVLAADAQGGSLQMLTSLSTYPEQIVLSTAEAQKLGITASTPLKQRLQALKGLQVAVTAPGGGLNYTLDYAINYAGLSNSDVSVVGITPYTAELSALHANQVPAIAPSAPWGSVAQADGYGIVIADIWGGKVPTLPSSDPFQVLAVNSSWASSHKKVVRAMRTALGEADAYIRKYPVKATQAAMKLLPGFKLATMRAAIGNGDAFPNPKSLVITKAQLAKIVSFSNTAGVNVGNPSYSQVVVGK
jgi:NitT/TauT family transport system substrate-binding protein